jgi:hypothetical protein
MSKRKIFGILIAICGVISLLFSAYIKNEVEEGKDEVKSAKKQVSQTRSLFNISSYTKPIGDQIAKSAGKEIAKGEKQIAYYSDLAVKLQYLGIALLVIGGVVFFIPAKKTRKRK